MLPKEERKVLVIVLIFLAKLQSWITPLFIKKKKRVCLVKGQRPERFWTPYADRSDTQDSFLGSK